MVEKCFSAGHSLYPILRLVVPEIDNARGTYNLKQKGIGALYLDIMNLPPGSTMFERIKNWRDPSRGKGPGSGGSVGEFTEIVEEMLETRVDDSPTKMTVGEVNATLDELVQAPDYAERKRIFSKIIKSFNATEQKWLLRIIIRDMKMGIRHQALLKSLHPTTKDVASICLLGKDTV